MHEKIMKSYYCAKEEVERWHQNVTVYDTRSSAKLDDSITCIYWIGRAIMLCQILESDFNERGLRREREQLEQMKRELQNNVIELKVKESVA